ncbi:MAG TPA: beta galactosidase jelly roll domain-containing protein [Solirubrobacteraceae bacterium]|nr:beta galactosidase jelly roll domain-containing protein [Solirubrobacteraceae bacterium]
MPARRLSLLLVAALAMLLACAGGAGADTRIVGLHGWQVQSSAHVAAGGARVSLPSFGARSWLHVRPDGAGAVGTELNALLQNGRCPHVFYGTNMKRCFGYMDAIGRDTIPEFAVPWWFRTTFRAPHRRGQRVELIVNGVVGAADVWVNGHELARHATVQGDDTRFAFDVTSLLRRGRNALALDVHPNDPQTMFTLDNVDWTQIPPDNNTGIQFPIELHTAGPLALSDAHVLQHDAPGMTSARLTLVGTVRNVTARAQRGTVAARVRAPGGSEAWALGRSVRVPGHGVRTVAFHLRLSHPQVWWPYGMGGQPLYRFAMTARSANGNVDSSSQTFGIRTITTRLVGASPLAPDGSRRFLVNGRPFVFRAGGWSEDLFLRYSPANTAWQIAMIKSLGLNGIRTEGKQMPENFYEQMDRAGILIDAGYQCCDAWQLQDSKLTSAHDFHILALSARTIGENLRDHPSVLNFSWSDDPPTPRQERVSVRAFRAAGFQDPLISSAEYASAPVLGPSGEKEGPYDWVPPSYWYDTTHYDPKDPTRTNVGGAWAFDSEASSGVTIPTLDSLRRFMSPAELRALWTKPNDNQYHLNYEKQLPNKRKNYGYAFGTLHDFDRALRARYGRWTGLASFVEEAQVQNYESQRAQFEAYIDHSTRAQAPSTGVVYWQLNKGWPSMLWTLYNSDGDEAGSFFGAQEANRPLHALYAYDTGDVAVDNLGPAPERDLTVQARVYDTAGRVLSDATSAPLDLASQGVAADVLHPKVPAAGGPARTYFVELVLRSGANVVDRNVYWLSTRPDVVDWKKTIGLPQATMTRYGSLRQLRSLPAAHVTVTASSKPAPGPDGSNMTSTVTITNDSSGSTVSFFVRADVRRGSPAGRPLPGEDEVLPVFWDTNDITLWPGESETLHASYRRSALHGDLPVVSVSGWNVPAMDVAAPIALGRR